MKSNLIKKTALAVALLASSQSAMSANESGSIALNDTMIFSLFVALALIFMLVIYVMVNTLKSILEISDLGVTRKEDKDSESTGIKAGMIAFLLFSSQYSMAQGADASEPLITMTTGLYWIMISFNAFLLGIIITLYYVSKGIINKLSGETEVEPDAVSQLTASLTDAVPIEREEEILLDHNYDGIKELDNNLPPWWKYGFYITIVVAVIYLANYHLLGTGDLQIAEYNKQMAAAEIELEAIRAEQANLVDESNLMALTDDTRLAAGKKVFINNCQVCHGQYGEGMVGPNLTDKYWKHGGGIKNIYNVIKVGVAEKGMISWESQLTPGQMHEVSSYILTLEGTDPPNQKAPEGEIWEGEAVDSAPSASDAEAKEEQEAETEIEA